MDQTRAHVRIAWAASTELGECPRWNATARSVDFADLARGELLRYVPATGERARLRVAPELGFLVIDASGGAIVGSGLDVLDLGTATFTRSEAPSSTPAPRWTLPGDPQVLRLNDARLDAHGALWTGTMDRRGRDPLGAIYRCVPGAAPDCVDGGYTIPNGFAINRAGDRLYVADSPRGCVHVYAVDGGGSRGDRRTWLRVSPEQGYPDGMTVDHDDHVWIAFYDGGCVRRYAPDGTLVREVRLPAPRITACAFGEDPDVLYATSAGGDGRPGLLQRLRGEPVGA